MENDKNHTVDLNQAEVLKSADHWGFTRYHNVSKGTFYDVPWGAMDWVGYLLIAVFVGGIGSVFLAFGTMVWRYPL